MFNRVKYASKDRESVRHNKDREGPVPIHVALKIHSETRNQGIIDRLFGLGLCISYDRVLGISSSVANAVIQQFEAEGAVFHQVLQMQLFSSLKLKVRFVLQVFFQVFLPQLKLIILTITQVPLPRKILSMEQLSPFFSTPVMTVMV